MKMLQVYYTGIIFFTFKCVIYICIKNKKICNDIKLTTISKLLYFIAK